MTPDQASKAADAVVRYLARRPAFDKAMDTLTDSAETRLRDHLSAVIYRSVYPAPTATPDQEGTTP